VTAITNRGGHWPAGEWIGETMRSQRAWSGSLIQCLKEAGMERATVGVCGLTRGTYSVVRQPDGYAGYTAVMRMKEALPEANFVSATGTNQLTDASASNFNRRFYRAVTP